jgi:hypothetical protein
VLVEAKSILLDTPAARHARGAVAVGAIVARGATPSRRCDTRTRARAPARKLARGVDARAVLLAWPSTSKARAPRSCSTARLMLLLGAAPIGSAVRAAAAEIDDFAFRPYVRTHSSFT